MKGKQFDSAAKALASPTRRGALLLAGVALCGLAGILERSAAAPGRGGDRQRSRKRMRTRQRRRARRRKSAGPALYPDLKTRPPELRLEFDQLDDGTYILRFTSMIWNAGEGPLELQAPTSPQTGESGQLYQNLYDAPIGGKVASRRPVSGRISYHETHNHFHFNDFASYLLLRRDAGGSYQPIGEGTKTSFCIIDSVLVNGSLEAQYTRCERTRQGLTPGRGDTYAFNLPEQWVVVGNAPLADGAYALQVTADPRSLLDEGGDEREQNNVATTYFAVEGGTIGSPSPTPP